MATSVDVIRDRVRDLLIASPFGLIEAVSPFDFELQPTGAIDEAFRIEGRQGEVIGGFNYSEEHTDELEIWVARKQAADPRVAYRLLLQDASAVRAAVIRDGLSGDYFVPPSGSDYQVQHEAGEEFAVLRLTIPVNFEVSIA